MEQLFSYGTLQLEKVQLTTFGRKLAGTEDHLKGYTLEFIQIIDPIVLSRSEKDFHPISVPSEKDTDSIPGTLYEISNKELIASDSYEVADYKRVLETFASGKKGWVYVKS